MRTSLDPPTDPAAYHYAHPVRVRFAETDAMGIVHHAAYLPYLEEARIAFLRAIDHPYPSIRAEGVDFTTLEVWARYLRPLRFDDVVQVHLLVGGLTRASFQMGYLLEVDGVACATAVTVHGAVTAEGRPTRLPAWLPELASRYPAPDDPAANDGDRDGADDGDGAAQA